MKLVIQRVTKARIFINKKIISEINYGYVVLVAFKTNEDRNNLTKMAQKLINLRIMPDKQQKMNLTIKDVAGELLLVPQFTLYADTSGRRPGFSLAEKPKLAEKLFNYFVAQVSKFGLRVESGHFGTNMQLELINDGPVTIILEN